MDEETGEKLRPDKWKTSKKKKAIEAQQPKSLDNKTLGLDTLTLSKPNQTPLNPKGVQYVDLNIDLEGVIRKIKMPFSLSE